MSSMKSQQREVANTLSKGRTTTFLHQQLSAHREGSERQPLAFWVIQLKAGSFDEKQPTHWGKCVEVKHGRHTEKAAPTENNGTGEIRKIDFNFDLTPTSSHINQSNGINLFPPGRNYTSSVIQCRIGYLLIKVLA
jgi:hypothetical protein